MPSRLDEIVASTRQNIEQTKKAADMRELDRRAREHTPRGFRAGLEARARTGPAIIAELKKASPSRGLLRGDFHPSRLAQQLEMAGAAALSVLTDEPFFQGSLRNLEEASAVTKLPCLRKDFMVDEFQMLEARAHGADAILLIVAALSQAELSTLARRARELELDVLCEVHHEAELARALDAGCEIVGVNSRDLRTFTVDLGMAFRLADGIPKYVLRVAESGIHSGEDIIRLRSAGYQAFLIGESLMKAESPGEALRKLMAESKVPTPAK